MPNSQGLNGRPRPDPRRLRPIAGQLLWLGYGLYYLVARRHEIAIARNIISGNLHAVFDPPPARDLIRHTTQEILRSYRNNWRYVDFFRWERRLHQVEIRDLDRLDKAFRRGKGVIACSCHSRKFSPSTTKKVAL